MLWNLLVLYFCRFFHLNSKENRLIRILVRKKRSARWQENAVNKKSSTNGGSMFIQKRQYKTVQVVFVLPSLRNSNRHNSGQIVTLIVFCVSTFKTHRRITQSSGLGKVARRQNDQLAFSLKLFGISFLWSFEVKIPANSSHIVIFWVLAKKIYLQYKFFYEGFEINSLNFFAFCRQDKSACAKQSVAQKSLRVSVGLLFMM